MGITKILIIAILFWVAFKFYTGLKSRAKTANEKKLNIKMKFDYEFKESFKDIPLHFDKDIANQGLSLYTELSNYQCNKIGS